ncbi:MAG: glycosyltransferase [Actinobacteria bacterium]|nr:glycosyltransferase [Actinomycetota bacterium]
MRRNTVFVTKELISDRMAGPAIRVVELAKVLLGDVDVAIATCALDSKDYAGVKLFRFNESEPGSLVEIIRNFDSIIVQGHIRQFLEAIYKYSGAMVVDLYNPFQFESLEMFSDRPMGERQNIDLMNYDELNAAAFFGDFYICASEKQRDMWIGYLGAHGRINPLTYGDDCSGRRLIDVVSFGIPDEPPVHRKKVLKGVISGIEAGDKVVLWGGGIWNWLDPLTPVRAIEEVVKKHPEIKFVFLGQRHPDARMPEMRIANEVENYCRYKGLLNRTVFFNRWVSYEDRGSYLLEADCGVSAHRDHLETTYSFRTRILDYIWAGVPIVSSSGDSMQEVIEKNGIGICVSPGDMSGYADAIKKAVFDDEFRDGCRRASASIKDALSWDNITKPLRDYCANPKISPDRLKILQQIEQVKKQFFVNVAREVMQEGDGFYLSSEKREEVEANFSHIAHFKKISKLKEMEGRFAWSLVFDDVDIRKWEDVILKSARLLKSGGRAAMICEIARDSKSAEDWLLRADGSALADDETVGRGNEMEGLKLISSFLWPFFYFEPYPADISRYSVIELDFKDFRGPTMIPRILRTDDINHDVRNFGKLKSILASAFFMNARSQINRYLKDLNHNVHLQLNREINELNAEQRSRIFSINRDFYRSISNFILFSSAILARDKGIEGGDLNFYLKQLENVLSMFNIKLLKINIYEKR